MDLALTGMVWDSIVTLRQSSVSTLGSKDVSVGLLEGRGSDGV